MDISSHYWINQELIKDVKFRIVIPHTNPGDDDDISSIRTRDWLVPGEKLIVFVEMGRTISTFDEFSFYCTVTDSEHTPQSPQTPKNESLLNLSLAITKKPLPYTPHIRKQDGKMYFPVRVQVPRTPSRSFIVSAFCLRNSTAVAQCECFSLFPFKVQRRVNMTPQSNVFQFSITCQLPEKWDKPIPISATNLKFNEAYEKEPAFTSSIAIIKTSESNFLLNNGEEASVAFILKPLSDDGAFLISSMRLSFWIYWSADGIEYIYTYRFTIGAQEADLAISAPMVKCQLLKPSSIPLRIINKSKEARKVDLCFGSGKIQPMTKRQEIEFGGGYEAKSVEFGFIPLCCGEYILKIWAEIGDKTVAPQFPICFSVEKTEQ